MLVDLQVVEDGFKLQNCLLAFWHMLNCSSEISAALALSCIMPKYLLIML